MYVPMCVKRDDIQCIDGMNVSPPHTSISKRLSGKLTTLNPSKKLWFCRFHHVSMLKQQLQNRYMVEYLNVGIPTAALKHLVNRVDQVINNPVSPKKPDQRGKYTCMNVSVQRGIGCKTLVEVVIDEQGNVVESAKDHEGPLRQETRLLATTLKTLRTLNSRAISCNVIFTAGLTMLVDRNSSLEDIVPETPVMMELKMIGCHCVRDRPPGSAAPIISSGKVL